MNRELFEKYINKTFDFKNYNEKKLKDEIYHALSGGYAVLVKVDHYCGNGQYRKCKFKNMIIYPFITSDCIATTDIYTNQKAAWDASIAARNGQTRVLEIIDAKIAKSLDEYISEGRFASYYLDGGIVLFQDM